jgi:ABC-type transporter Mla subunit MlaD
MKRIAAILLIVGAGAALLVSGSAAGGDDGTYEVRAIFDNAGFLVTAEDVRVAGAKVGTVTDIDVTAADEVAHEDGSTEGGKAVVVMRIDDPGFQDFRQDASCLIRPQSLIGEKFVECSPTQPRAAGTIEPPALEPIADGEPGEGQYLLPVERNGKAVDLDLVNNIMKEPYPDRFRLILNELGAGLAARGQELAEIVDRANPALRETNEVLAILARQNHALSGLARDSDQILSALARDRESVVGFINSATVAGQATAERRADLEAGFSKLPGFLRELRSTMVQLNQFSDAATPVFSDLGSAAPALTRVNKALGPFADAGTTSFQSLGDASEQSAPALVGSDSVLRQIRGLANDAKPATKDTAQLFASLRKTNGFQYLLETIYGIGGSVNGFDSFGHFLRALVPVQNCFDYTVIPQNGCDQHFGVAFVPTTAPAGKAPLSKQARRERRRAARGQSAEQRSGGLVPGGDLGGEATPRVPSPAPETAPAPDGVQEQASPTDAANGAADEQRMRAARDLLDFLIGKPDRPGKGQKR